MKYGKWRPERQLRWAKSVLAMHRNMIRKDIATYSPERMAMFRQRHQDGINRWSEIVENLERKVAEKSSKKII